MLFNSLLNFYVVLKFARGNPGKIYKMSLKLNKSNIMENTLKKY